MGDPAGRQRGLCRQHGRRAGGLSEAARSAASARVPRRNLEAADHRDARADPRQAGTQGASRLRIRTQWRRQSVHGVRAAGRVAACESDRPPHRHRLCPYAQGCVGRAFSRRGEDRAGAGQSQHPQARLALRSLPRRRGTPARRALRVALHAQCFESLSTAVGSTWPNPNSACSRRSVWIAASPTSKSSPTKSTHGRTTATSTTPRPTGNSKPPTPASS